MVDDRTALVIETAGECSNALRTCKQSEIFFGYRQYRSVRNASANDSSLSTRWGMDPLKLLQEDLKDDDFEQVSTHWARHAEIEMGFARGRYRNGSVAHPVSYTAGHREY